MQFQCQYKVNALVLGPWAVHDVITDKLRFTREWSTHGQPWSTMVNCPVINYNRYEYIENNDTRPTSSRNYVYFIKTVAHSQS